MKLFLLLLRRDGRESGDMASRVTSFCQVRNRPLGFARQGSSGSQCATSTRREAARRPRASGLDEPIPKASCNRSSRPASPRRHPKPSRVKPSFSAIAASSRSTAGNPLAEQACDLRRLRSGRPLIRHSRGNTTPHSRSPPLTGRSRATGSVPSFRPPTSCAATPPSRRRITGRPETGPGRSRD